MGCGQKERLWAKGRLRQNPLSPQSLDDNGSQAPCARLKRLCSDHDSVP
ncbi:hypothetical protein C4K00_2477 [Pseudomonas synxantha]|nr:hypothetical protein C4K00_2477 [Pseudomonas synxantha]